MAPGAGGSVKTWSQAWPLNLLLTKKEEYPLNEIQSGTTKTCFLRFCFIEQCLMFNEHENCLIYFWCTIAGFICKQQITKWKQKKGLFLM